MQTASTPTLVMVILLLMIGSSSCSAQKKSPLWGKWSMHQVWQHGENVTKQHNPQQDRWIEFSQNGTFRSNGTPYGPNSGGYHIESDGTLFIDSDAGPDDDSRWNYSFKEGHMTWTGVGSEFAKGFVIIYQRIL